MVDAVCRGLGGKGNKNPVFFLSLADFCYFCSMTKREQYIADHAALFWYTPEAKKKDISDSLLVETILNYGTMEDVKALFGLMGMDKVAEVFFAAKGRQKQNYFPQIYNFFTLVFNRYVPQCNPERQTN